MEFNLAECRGADDYGNVIKSVKARLTEIDSAAAGRPLDEESRGEFNDLLGVLKEAEAARAEVEERARVLAELAEKPENVSKPEVRKNRAELRRTPEDIYDLAAYRARTTNDAQLNQALRDGAMRSLDSITFRHDVDQAKAKEGVQKLLDHKDIDGRFARQFLLTSDPEYVRGFHKYINGQPLTEKEQRGTALAMEVVGTGGYLVPAVMDPTMINIGAWTNINPIRATARIEQIVAGQNTWHGLTSTAVTATRADEAAVTTEQGPTFAQPSITPTKVQGQITFSVETGQDRPDLESEMSRLIAEAKDNEEESIFSTGAGGALGSLTVPTGVVPAHGTAGAFDHTHCAADGTFAIGDVDAVFAALPLRFRSRAIWLMSRPLIGTVQGFETTGGRLFGGTNGYPNVGMGYSAANGDTGLRLLGRPVYEHPSGSASSADGANKMLLAVYDPSTYCIVDRVGMTVELIPFIFGAGQGNLVTGQRGLYFYWRNSAKPLFTTGGQILYHMA